MPQLQAPPEQGDYLQKLLMDLLGFAGEGVSNFAKQAGESTQRNAGIVNAVARGEKPNMQGVASSAMGASNPMNVAGIIAPTANPILQQLLAALRQRAPKLVQQAEGVAETVRPYLVPRESMPVEGAVGAYRKSRSLPSGELYLRGGRPQAEQVDTLGHELRHFLTGFDPRQAAKQPAHKLETAQQLTEMMPPPQKAAMQQHYLPQQAQPTAATRFVPGEQINPAAAGRGGLAHDEALSYLTESLLQGNRGGDPMLEAIANALGQGIR